MEQGECARRGACLQALRLLEESAAEKVVEESRLKAIGFLLASRQACRDVSLY